MPSREVFKCGMGSVFEGTTCYGPVLDRNSQHSTRLFTDIYKDTDLALA